jgi:O-acetyl-ADP-ribose deacetylase (regulator of RNase III)
MLTFIRGDITTIATDAIVNAANSGLLPGGGVCGAIHAAAGPDLARACAAYVREHGRVATGHAAITPGYRLPARYVIHAVGPVWSGGDAGEERLLASAYAESIALAEAHELGSIAFPSISTGIYGYPVERAAPVAVAAVRDSLARASHVRSVTFVLFDERTFQVFSALDVAS